MVLYPEINKCYQYQDSHKSCSINYSSEVYLPTGYTLINNVLNTKLQLIYIIIEDSTSSSSRARSIVFTASNVRQICMLIESHIMIYNKLTISHALYLGKELAKAEISLIMNQQYNQE
uniref:DUF4346 domain-containing protein n=1 Tax=Balbiania investiens TaxID=111861 RepID=A0A4D6BP23_9FLOR|nr:hypothetical protein [Balbiania investiens]QBX88693.1 hypothetical protein [Balbiania investiens]